MNETTADRLDAKLRKNPALIEVTPTVILDQFFALRHAEALVEDDQWVYQNDSGASADACWGIPAAYAQQMREELDYLAVRKGWDVTGDELYQCLIALDWNPPGFPVVIA